MQAPQAQIERLPSSSSEADIALQAIPPRNLGDVFPMVSPLLESIAERSNGRYSVPGMLDRFARGDWILWVVWDGSVKAVVATELYHDVSGMLCCMIRFATGREASKWAHLIDEIEEWARANGCKRLDMLARKGWAKHLPDYKMSHVFLEKDLT